MASNQVPKQMLPVGPNRMKWPSDSMTLKTIVANQIWHAQHPVRFGPMRLLTRMTVVKLSDDSLWVHSPIPLDGDLKQALAERGEVRHVVAPNLYHHLFFADFMHAYPAAVGWIAPGLARKKPVLAGFQTLDTAERWAWSDDLDSVFIEGLPEINETVWFHRPSGTLIVTDLLFCFGRANGVLNTVIARMLGVYDRIGMSRTMKWSIKDKAAFRASVDAILDWDVKRVILAHDQIVELDSIDSLRAALTVR